MSIPLAVAFIILAIMGVICIIGIIYADNKKIQKTLNKLLIKLVYVLSVDLLILFGMDIGFII